MARRVEVKPTKDMKLVGKILFDPELAKIALPPEEVELIEDGMELEPSSNYNYLLISVDGETAGLFRYSMLTTITATWHIHLFSKYWGTSVSDKAEDLALQWFKENTHFKKVIAESPEDCREVQRALIRRGYQVEGALVNAINWNNRIQHLLLFGKEI